MRRAFPVLLALCLVAASSARAAEFLPSWSVDGVWDSNVLRTRDDADSDFSVRTGPDLRVREKQGDLLFDVTYAPRYEAFATIDGINEFDHFVTANGSWRATPTTFISMSNDFAYSSSLGGIFETIPGAINQVNVVTPTRERITTNYATVGVDHQLSRLWAVSLQGTSQFYEYENVFSSDSLANSVQLQVTRRITPRLITGLGTAVQRQDFQGTNGAPDSGTTFYQGFLVGSYDISPTFSITANAGPAWSDPDSVDVQSFAFLDYVPQTLPCSGGVCSQALYRSEPPGFVAPIVPGQNGAPPLTVSELTPAEVDGSLSYFGRVSIAKDWRDWSASAQFQRNASTTAGVGGSTILTAAYGRLRWKPSQMWFIEWGASYTLQEAANEITQPFVQQSFENIVPNAVLDLPGGGSRLFIADPVLVQRSASRAINNAIDITTMRFDLHAERMLRRHLRLEADVSYWQQDSKGDLVSEGTTEVWRIVLGFTWNFDAIPL